MASVSSKRRRMSTGNTAVEDTNSLSDLPSGILVHAATFLATPSRALFAAALMDDAQVVNQLSSAIAGDETTLDFGDIEEDLALNLSDGDINLALLCIDAVNKLKKLRITNCVNITGIRLEPLRGSAIIQQIDLSLTCDGEGPSTLDLESSISFGIVLPILDSIIERGVVQHITLPRIWREERLEHHFMEGEVHQFLIRYNQMLSNRNRQGSCTNCNSDLVGVEWVEIDDTQETYGLQNYICCRCMKIYCYGCSCRVVACDQCERLCCQECTTTLFCDHCDTYYCADTDSTVDFNVTALEEHINKQGTSHAEMMQAIEGTFSVVDVDRTIPQPTGKEVRSVRSGEGEESEPFFDVYDEAKGWALKYMDGYAVLKIEGFRMGFEPLLLVWTALSEECKRQGITKLIVDISNNGGGKGILGPTLATLMYPTAAHNWYTKNNALVINEPMQIYKDKIEPLLDDLLDFFQNRGNSNTTDEALGAIIQIQGLTDSRMKQVNDAIDIFRTFCVGITAGNDCASLDNFQEEWATFAAYKSPPLLKQIIDQMVVLIKTFNRFSEWDSDFADFDKTVIKTVNQGGMETNLTSFFTDYTSNMYYAAVATSLQNNANFDEYVLLSNGVAGSTAHTYSSKVMQLWNNRDKTEVTTKLTTVSYGGLKEDNGDVTMACLTAVVEDVHLENELIAAGVVYLFNKFILVVSNIFDEASSALEEYYESLPEVPYFAKSLPRMPVVGDPYGHPTQHVTSKRMFVV